MANILDTVLRFIFDQASANQTKAGAAGVADAVGGVGDAADKASKRTKQAADRSTDSLGEWGFSARELTADYRRLFFASERLQYIAQQTFVSGAFITGGIFALANKYVKEATTATSVTRDWQKATEDLGAAGSRVGAAFAEAALPTLEKVARLTEQAADFLEAHPRIAQIALDAGLLLGGLGILELAVSKGIKMYLGAEFLISFAQGLIAARLQKLASAENLAAAATMKAAADTNLAAAGQMALARRLPAGVAALGALARVLPFLGTAGAALAGGAIYNRAAEANNLPNAGEAIKGANLIAIEKMAGRLADLFNKTAELTNRIGFVHDRAIKNANFFESIVERAGDALVRLGQKAGFIPEQLESVSERLAGSKNEEAVVEAFTKYREAEIAATQETESRRLQIIEEAGKAMVAATAKYQAAILDIQTSAQSQRIAAINSQAQAEQQAEDNLEKQRAEILRDAGIDILDIEQDLQEKLRRMRLEHNDRMADLEGQRDAIGLVLEQRNYQRERAQEIRDANIEIARRRRDLAIKLADLDANFRAEQIQRQQHLAEQLAQINAQEQEKLQQAQETYKTEQKQIAAQERDKLIDLRNSANRERQVRYDAFIQQIRDLDRTLLGERTLRNAYYNVMLQDAENFFAAYRATANNALSQIGGVDRGREFGGYVGAGLYRMHPHEFVMNRTTTQAAERAIGGNLNQQNIAASLSGGRGDVRITQNIRYSGEVSAGDRREIRRIAKEGALEAIESITRG